MIKCIFYDCVGPLLIKNPGIKLEYHLTQIDQMCGSITNDKEFWKQVQSQFNLSPKDIDEVADQIAASYMKNDLMWEFHGKICDTYKTAIINNGTFTIFKKWIEKYEMSLYFDNFFNSARLGVCKPDKKIFEICAREMDVDLNDCVFIDDSQYNVEGAISAGMTGLCYNPADHQDFLTSFDYLLTR